MLYQCHLNPHTPCTQLSADQIRQLRSTLLRILKKAVTVEADATRFPRNWLFHYRWGKKAESDAKGKAIQFDQIGGRTTAWVPELQP